MQNGACSCQRQRLQSEYPQYHGDGWSSTWWSYFPPFKNLRVGVVHPVRTQNEPSLYEDTWQQHARKLCPGFGQLHNCPSSTR